MHVHYGHCEYCIMSYGLACAPSVFQCLINDVLSYMLGTFVICDCQYWWYFDILSFPWKSHKSCQTNIIPSKGESALLGEKWKFHAPTISFLGYIIDQVAVTMDKTKVTAVTEWPTPHIVKDLPFLGFASFYQLFIQGFRSITTPLNTFLKRCPKMLPWNQVTEVSFTKLKSTFTTAPILRHPDPSKLFISEVATSEPDVRAVLSQCFREQPKLDPVAFFS